MMFDHCNMEAAKISASAVEKTSELKELHNNIQKKLVEDHDIDVILGEQQFREAVQNLVCLPQYQLDKPRLVETGELYTKVLLNLACNCKVCYLEHNLVECGRSYRPALSSLFSCHRYNSNSPKSSLDRNEITLRSFFPRHS